MSNDKKQDSIVRAGDCPACLGDGGTMFSNYVDENSVYHPYYFSVCPACDGSGKDVRYKNKPINK